MTKESKEKIYFNIIQWGVYLALFAPFIFIEDYFFPFVVPKTIFFRVFVDIIFLAYIPLAISNPKYRPKFNALTITITIFLIVLILTSITGANFARSFWGPFERMTGLLTFFHLYVFYIILISVFKERKYWERILSVSIFVCLLISIIVLTSNDPTTRGGGSLGNSSFYSAYLLFNLFFTIVLLVIKEGFWRFFYGIALIVFLAGLFFNPGGFTKGAISAFFVGLFILGFGYLIFCLFSSDRKKTKKITILIIVLIIIGTLGLTQLSFIQKEINKIWNSNSLQSRLVVWQMGWQGWREKFWLGWGPENFYIPFAKYYNPELPLTHDIWYDRVHNIILDTGVSSGILGLLSYLAIFGVAILGLLQLLPKIFDKKNVLVPLVLIVLLVVYFLQNIWVFDMVSSYIVFFLSLAFINFLISSPNEEIVKIEKPNYLSSFVGGILIILTIFTFYFGNIKVAQASKYTVRGMSFPLEESLSYFKKALKTSPISRFETPEQLSTKIITLARQKDQNQQLLREGFKLAEEEMKKSLKEDPLNFRFHLFLGKYYNNRYSLTNNKEDLKLAEESLNKAKELSPKNQQVYWFLAQTRLYEGKHQEAIDLLQKAVDLEPRLAQSNWFLAIGYLNAGKYQLALNYLKKAEELGFNWKGNINSLKQGIEIYKGIGDSDTLLSLYKLGTELSPNEADFWAGLANAYASKGEREKAKEAAEELLKLKPEVSSQIEQFLEQLGY